jgi:hypothetical protein
LPEGILRRNWLGLGRQPRRAWVLALPLRRPAFNPMLQLAEAFHSETCCLLGIQRFLAAPSRTVAFRPLVALRWFLVRVVSIVFGVQTDSPASSSDPFLTARDGKLGEGGEPDKSLLVV